MTQHSAVPQYHAPSRESDHAGRSRSKAKKDRVRDRKENARRKLNAWVERCLPPEVREQAKARWFNGGTREQLAILLKSFGSIRENGKVASFETLKARQETLYLAFGQLRDELGCKMADVRVFKAKHVRRLIGLWIAKGNEPSTINKRLSILRTFARWIGKPGVVPGVDKLAHVGYSPKVAARRSAATEDKSWGHVEKEALIARVEQYDLRYGLILRLQDLFGLRKLEAIMFCPHEDHREGFIQVWDGEPAKSWEHLAILAGTKGGRFREVIVETDAQRALITRCKAVVEPQDSMSGKLLRSLQAARRRYDSVAGKFGIRKRALGKTGHGLRHGYVHEQYRQAFGQEPPVRDPESPRPKGPNARQKRKEIMLAVGHSRPTIITAYSGPARPSRKPP